MVSAEISFTPATQKRNKDLFNFSCCRHYEASKLFFYDVHNGPVEEQMETTLRSGMNKVLGALGVSLALGVSTNAWSAFSAENPLGDSYYNTPLYPRVDMSNIKLNYIAGKWGLDSLFTGYSQSSSTFTLVKPDQTTATFGKAIFGMAAIVSPAGAFKSGGFTILSGDSTFGFGKDKWGNAKIGNVFSGSINSIGWSESKARLEFGTSKFSGWACAQGWCTSAERLYFNMNSSTLGLTSALNSGKNWSNTAKGTAVIPVPAAAWLFGSGLIGLMGVAKRKRHV